MKIPESVAAEGGETKNELPESIAAEAKAQIPESIADVAGEAKAASAGGGGGLLALATRCTALKKKKPRKTMRRDGSLVRRPHRSTWFRTRPDWRADVYLFSDTNGTNYLLTEDVYDALGRHAHEGVIHGAVDLDGEILLIPAKSDDGDAAASFAEALELAQSEWVQVAWDPAQGKYEYSTPAEPVDDPVWPKRSWAEIFNTSVRKVFIDSTDHEVVARVLYARI